MTHVTFEPTISTCSKWNMNSMCFTWTWDCGFKYKYQYYTKSINSLWSFSHFIFYYWILISSQANPKVQPTHKILWTTVFSTHANFQPPVIDVNDVAIFQLERFVLEVQVFRSKNIYTQVRVLVNKFQCLVKAQGEAYFTQVKVRWHLNLTWWYFHRGREECQMRPHSSAKLPVVPKLQDISQAGSIPHQTNCDT